jgi:dephospho-CoA kinase
MKIIGLTGSIAMGKSFITQQFLNFGVPVFDCDIEVAKILSNNQEVKADISKIFPAACINGEIDKKKLGEIVFNNKKAKERLEEIIYPVLDKEIDSFIKDNQLKKEKVVILDIPLLFEKGYEKKYNFDHIILASAPFYIQKKRALKRPNMTEEKLEAILKTQLSNMIKKKKADFIINTGISKKNTISQVKEFLNRIGNERAS